MVAAAVLFDDRLALGALLGVGTEPVACFAVVSALFEPDGKHFTTHGRVRWLGTTREKKMSDGRSRHTLIDAPLEAKLVTAETLHGLWAHSVELQRIFAPGRRAPLDVLVTLGAGKKT